MTPHTPLRHHPRNFARPSQLRRRGIVPPRRRRQCKKHGRRHRQFSTALAFFRHRRSILGQTVPVWNRSSASRPSVNFPNMRKPLLFFNKGNKTSQWNLTCSAILTENAVPPLNSYYTKALPSKIPRRNILASPHILQPPTDKKTTRAPNPFPAILQPGGTATL